MVLENLIKLCVPDFLGKYFLPHKIGEIGQKWGFLNLKKNFVINFSLNLLCNENLFNLLRSCTNLLFGKNIVSEI